MQRVVSWCVFSWMGECRVGTVCMLYLTLNDGINKKKVKDGEVHNYLLFFLISKNMHTHTHVYFLLLLIITRQQHSR